MPFLYLKRLNVLSIILALSALSWSLYVLDPSTNARAASPSISVLLPNEQSEILWGAFVLIFSVAAIAGGVLARIKMQRLGLMGIFIWRSAQFVAVLMWSSGRSAGTFDFAAWVVLATYAYLIAKDK